MKPPLPSLDEIAANVSRDQIPALVTALMMRLVTEPPVVVARDHGDGRAPDETLDVPAIAQVLKKSRRWIWRNQKRLPLHRVGRGLLASRADLDRWLAAQKIR